MLYINRIQAIHKFIFNPVSILSLRSLRSAVYKYNSGNSQFYIQPCKHVGSHTASKTKIISWIVFLVGLKMTQ